MDNEKFKDSVIKKLEDLCNRMARMEERLAGHMKSNEKQSKTRRELVLIIIAAAGVIAATLQAVT